MEDLLEGLDLVAVDGVLAAHLDRGLGAVHLHGLNGDADLLGLDRFEVFLQALLLVRGQVGLDRLEERDVLALDRAAVIGDHLPDDRLLRRRERRRARKRRRREGGPGRIRRRDRDRGRQVARDQGRRYGGGWPPPGPPARPPRPPPPPPP